MGGVLGKNLTRLWTLGKLAAQQLGAVLRGRGSQREMGEGAEGETDRECE